MLDIRYLRDNLDDAEARLASRGTAAGLESFRALDARRRALLGESEVLKAERNSVSPLIGSPRLREVFILSLKHRFCRLNNNLVNHLN